MQTGTETASTVEVTGVQNLLSRFWGFDKLIGSALVKILYYLGLAGIAIWMLIALAGSIGVASYSAGAGLGGMFVTIVGGAFAAIFWRFTCELWLIVFQIYNRLGEIRDRLPHS